MSQTIHYEWFLSPIGGILLASSDEGIVHLSISDHPKPILLELKNRFADSDLLATDLTTYRLAILDWLQDTTRVLRLPLVTEGTDFQKAVWQALRTIEPGQCKTYSDIAEQLGNPRGVRAVASACASNEIAILIPCHRVIRRDGGLGGYRWGMPVKQALLDLEKQSKRQ